MCRHVAHFYEDEYPAEPVADFFAAGLETGERCVALLSAPHRRAVECQLLARGVDVANADYLAVDTDQVLAQMQVDGQLDLGLAEALLAPLMSATVDGRCQGVRAAGDLAPTLFKSGRTDDAVAFENLVHRVTQANGAATLCAYPLPTHADGVDMQALLRLGAEHAELIFPRRLWVQRWMPSQMRGADT